MQPNLNWALVDVRTSFVADALSQNLKTNSLNTKTNNARITSQHFLFVGVLGSKFFLRDLGFDVRIEMQKYTKAVEATTMIPQAWSGCVRGGLEAALHASRHGTKEWSQN